MGVGGCRPCLQSGETGLVGGDHIEPAAQLRIASLTAREHDGLWDLIKCVITQLGL